MDSSEIKLGTKVQKFFEGYGVFQGTVISQIGPFYRVLFEDGDDEDMDLEDLKSCLLVETADEGAAVKEQQIPEEPEEPSNEQPPPTDHDQQPTAVEEQDTDTDSGGETDRSGNDSGKLSIDKPTPASEESNVVDKQSSPSNDFKKEDDMPVAKDSPAKTKKGAQITVSKKESILNEKKTDELPSFPPKPKPPQVVPLPVLRMSHAPGIDEKGNYILEVRNTGKLGIYLKFELLRNKLHRLICDPEKQVSLDHPDILEARERGLLEPGDTIVSVNGELEPGKVLEILKDPKTMPKILTLNRPKFVLKPLLTVHKEPHNADFCSLCFEVGDLVCCETCPRSFHATKCLKIPVESIPDKWVCFACDDESREMFRGEPWEVTPPLSGLARIKTFHTWVMAKDVAYEFNAPVDWKNTGLLNYPQIVKHPMDFGTIQVMLDDGVIDDSDMGILRYVQFFRLVIFNCNIFNLPNGSVARSAEILSVLFERFYLIHLRPVMRQETRVAAILSQVELLSSKSSDKYMEIQKYIPGYDQAATELKIVPINFTAPVQTNRKGKGARQPSTKKPAVSTVKAESKTSKQAQAKIPSRDDNKTELVSFKTVGAVASSSEKPKAPAPSKKDTPPELVPEPQSVRPSDSSASMQDREQLMKLLSEPLSSPSAVVKEGKDDKMKPTLSSRKRARTPDSQADSSKTKQGTVTENKKCKVTSGNKKKGSPSSASKQKHKEIIVGVTKIMKDFPPYGLFEGTVISYDSPYYKVRFEDGDEEEYDSKEMTVHMKAHEEASVKKKKKH